MRDILRIFGNGLGFRSKQVHVNIKLSRPYFLILYPKNVSLVLIVSINSLVLPIFSFLAPRHKSLEPHLSVTLEVFSPYVKKLPQSSLSVQLRFSLFLTNISNPLVFERHFFYSYVQWGCFSPVYQYKVNIGNPSRNSNPVHSVFVTSFRPYELVIILKDEKLKPERSTGKTRMFLKVISFVIFKDSLVMETSAQQQLESTPLLDNALRYFDHNSCSLLSFSTKLK